MCGRFTLTVDPSQLEELFPWVSLPTNFTPRYNIAPSQPVAVIPNVREYRVDYFQWGLIPSWAKDPSIGSRLINARSETVSEKPSFRNALKRRRCLILADGFYEWTTSSPGRSKIPMYIRLKSGKPFAFAGLWDTWNSPDGSLISTCAIITTQPNALITAVHNRMPVILPQAEHLRWIETNEIDPQNIQNLLTSFPSELMEAYPVSTDVNMPSNDYPSLVNKVIVSSI